MTRRGFHIELALTLVACVLCPYVEGAIHWDQTIFDTGYDGESTVAIIALLLILVFVVATVLLRFVAHTRCLKRLVKPRWVFRPMLDFFSCLSETSPPLPLRI